MTAGSRWTGAMWTGVRGSTASPDILDVGTLSPPYAVKILLHHHDQLQRRYRVHHSNSSIWSGDEGEFPELRGALPSRPRPVLSGRVLPSPMTPLACLTSSTST